MVGRTYLSFPALLTTLEACDEDDDCDDDGGDNGSRGRDDDPVHLLGGPNALGPDLAALLERHRARGDLQVFQGHHAHHNALLKRTK